MAEAGVPGETGQSHVVAVKVRKECCIHVCDVPLDAARGNPLTQPPLTLLRARGRKQHNAGALQFSHLQSNRI